MRAKAAAFGFDLCRVTTPDAIPEAPARLDAWLATGAAGDMAWMDATRQRRADPRVLWPDVRSIILLGINYGPDSDPMALLAQKSAANISVYARNRDYHELIKGKLKQLGAWLVAQADDAQIKVFVDTAPVMEKPLAQAAGVGWQGKHTNLVSRDFGAWLFLGSIFTDQAIAADAPETDHCGACRACLDICPTNAFPAPYQLDARRCISYLTIEHKGHIPVAFRKAIGNRVYGCDDCLAVCPWNKFAQTAREAKVQARAEFAAPSIAAWLVLDDAAFRRVFAQNPVKRIGSERFMRNLLIAAGNAGDDTLIPAVEAKLAASSALVRAMAVWALSQIGSPAQVRAFAERWRGGETDTTVQAEWTAALPANAEHTS